VPYKKGIIYFIQIIAILKFKLCTTNLLDVIR